ncbi:MAG: hypothetical protein AAF999_02505 [Pseudomonadota bacterium]
MRFMTIALILGLASASTAQAGAWLRQKGKGFTSLSVQTTEDNGSSSSFYFEYGFRESVTLGADITYDTDLLNYVQGAGPVVQSLAELPQASGILFARFPIGPTDRTNKWAFHVGVGARYLEAEILEAVEVGLSWGRGIQIGERYGWVNIDTSYNEARSPAETRKKLDATVGLGVTDRTKAMLQVFNTFEAGETFTKVAPSLLYKVGDKGLTLQLGSEIPTQGGDATVKIGLWWEF